MLVDGEPATIESMRRVGGGRRAIRLDRKVERGAELAVPARTCRPPDPDSYYAFQLVGLDGRRGGRASSSAASSRCTRGSRTTTWSSTTARSSR